MSQSERGTRRNAGYFMRFLIMLAVVIALFSVLFHFIMLIPSFCPALWPES